MQFSFGKSGSCFSIGSRRNVFMGRVYFPGKSVHINNMKE